MPKNKRAPVIDMTWITSALCRSPPHVLEGITAICESLLRSREHGYVKRRLESGQLTTDQNEDRRRPVKKREAVVVEKVTAPAAVVETPVPTATGEAAAPTTTPHPPRSRVRRRRKRNAERSTSRSSHCRRTSRHVRRRRLHLSRQYACTRSASRSAGGRDAGKHADTYPARGGRCTRIKTKLTAVQGR